MSNFGDTGAWGPSTRMRKVRDGVAEAFGVEPWRLVGRGRRQWIVWPRHVAMWVVKQCFPQLSYPQIAQLFARSDHSTAHYAIRKVAERRERDTEFARLTDAMVAAAAEGAPTLALDEELREVADSVSEREEREEKKAEDPGKLMRRAERIFHAEVASYPMPLPSRLNLGLAGEAGDPLRGAAAIEERREAVLRERRARELGLLEAEKRRYRLQRRAKPLSEMVL